MTPRNGRRRIGRGATVLAVVIAATTAVADVAAAPDSIDTAASVSTPARFVTALSDMVSVNNTGELQASVRDSAVAAAQDVGAPWVIGRGFTIGMTAVRRGTAVVQQASGPSGLWRFPMSVTALPPEAIASTMGRNVSAFVGGNSIVMSQTSASLRGAQVGDTVDLVADGGGIRTFVIGRIASDEEVGGTEITMTTEQADVLGARVPTRVLIFGQFDRAALEGRLLARGLMTNSKIRVRKSWDAFDPDLTLGLAATKQLLGEFDFTLSSSGAMSIDSAWTTANIPNYTPGAPYNIPGQPVRNNCHQRIKADLLAALNEVAAAGLTFTMSNGTTGGCFNPRFARAGIGLYIGSVSRHAWAQAMDINTVSNCQGCVPKMDCRVVRIFRKHNFAWGGNFLFADGMHFEWVGTRRDGYQYPSKYCPNLAPPGTESVADPPPMDRALFFADDGFMLDGGE